MLSRTADHLFWMARYTERAENTARMLDVTVQTALLPQSAEAAEQGGGGILDGLAYANILTELTVEMSELDSLGVQLKDFERGLVDFPSLRDGKVVLLCWQMGEGDELEWWHDVDAGFAGRTPLD